MGRRTTIADIARRAGVSNWTVSHVLNRRADVSIADATRARVMQAAADMGYRPNPAARALANGRTQLVALWVIAGDSYSPYFARVQYELQRRVLEGGYRALTEDVPLPDAHRRGFARLLNWPVDGVMACDVAGPADAYVSAAEGRPPLVSLGVWCVEAADYVRLDLAPGSRDAVRHLLTVGCRRIAFVGPAAHDDRAAAYEEVMREAGRPAELVHTPANDRASIRAFFHDYLMANGRPDGLFCQNDDRAIACCRALADLGLRVPEDVAVVGCDGIEETEYRTAPISTIQVPVGEMCDLAWRALRARMTDPLAPPRRHVLTPPLVVRESSRR